MYKLSRLRLRKCCTLAPSLVAVGLAATCGRGATLYTFMDIGTSASYSIATGISNNGLVTGTYGSAPFPSTGFIWNSAGTLQSFDVPGANPTFGTEAQAINSQGVVVGSYFPGCCTRSGFYRSASGQYTTVLDGSTVRGLNDVGQIVGAIGTNGEITTLGGPITTFTIPSQTFLLADGINNVGQVVGYYGDSSGTHSFLRNADGSIVTFDAPGSIGTTVANGINDQGQIVGYYSDGSIWHGYLRDSNGSFTIIDRPVSPGFPFSSSTFLYGINNSGTIVGSYTGPAFQGAFVASAGVPEPSSEGLVLLGILSGVVWKVNSKAKRLRVVFGGRGQIELLLPVM